MLFIFFVRVQSVLFARYIIQKHYRISKRKFECTDKINIASPDDVLIEVETRRAA